VEQGFLAAGALLLHGQAFGQDQAVAGAVELDDLQLEHAAAHRGQALGDLRRLAAFRTLGQPAQLGYLRNRHEAAHADVDDEAPLVIVDDRRFDDAFLVHLLLGLAPRLFHARALEREDGMTLDALRLHHVDQHALADAQGPTLTRRPQLAAGDHALGLLADVDEDFVGVDARHAAFDDLAALQGMHRVARALEERGHRRFGLVGRDVAGAGLRSARRGRGAGGTLRGRRVRRYSRVAGVRVRSRHRGRQLGLLRLLLGLRRGRAETLAPAVVVILHAWSPEHRRGAPPRRW